MLHDIGEKVGKYLNDDNWINAVNNYGKIRVMDIEVRLDPHRASTTPTTRYALVAYDSSIPPEGDWRYLTAVEDVGTG